jgi:hypothetical protein
MPGAAWMVDGFRDTQSDYPHAASESDPPQQRVMFRDRDGNFLGRAAAPDHTLILL